MFGWLTGPSKVQRTAEGLYDRVVTAARSPGLYSTFGVADDAEGRFEMLALHLFLALEALKTGPDEAGYREAVTQRVIERFVTDMDDCMREMAVGDMAVPKRVKRAAAGFYERAGAYRAGLEAVDHKALIEAVRQHVFATSTQTDGAPQLADYIASAFGVLKASSIEGALSDPQLERLRSLTSPRAA
jgi:cytochrome b pre-mRNA-processing protein 3